MDFSKRIPSNKISVGSEENHMMVYILGAKNSTKTLQSQQITTGIVIFFHFTLKTSTETIECELPTYLKVIYIKRHNSGETSY